MASIHGLVNRVKGKTAQSSASFIQCGNAKQMMASGGDIFTFVGAAGTGADTTEDLLASTLLLAGAFDTINSFELGTARALWMYAAGSVANNAHVKTVRMYFGAGIVLSVAPTVSAVTPWALELFVIKSGVNTQFAQGQSINGSTHTGVQNFAGAENDSANITLKITGQTATSGANDVVLNAFQVQFFN